ncbi:MAG TPA: AraC family transcriptional regulator [Rhodocyclaceae bacterium]
MPDDPPAFEGFAKRSRAAGYNDVVERVWPPATIVDTHTHPFALHALVVRGEMWLTAAGTERHLVPGDEFSLECDEPHAERYGEAGATYWVARRNR